MSKIRALSTIMLATTVVAGCGDSGAPTSPSPSLSGTSSTNPVVAASGAAIAQTRPVSGFDAVEIGVPGRLTIEHASVGSLIITADEAVLAAITSEVRDGRLVIGLAPSTDLRLRDPLEIEYRVTVPELHRLDVNGTVHAVASGITASPFEANVSGSSTVAVSGSTNRQTVSLSGSSRYEARALVTRDTTLSVHGTAWAIVSASDTLDGQVAGAAVVRYVGAPVVSVSVAGTASVGPE